MECKFIWNQEKKPRRNYKDYQYTTTYPTDRIKKQKFESSEQVSAFLLRNAQEIGYCKWQLFQKSIIDQGDHMRIMYTCRSKLCDAELVFHQKKVDIVQDGQYSKKFYLAAIRICNVHNHPLKLTRKLANQQNIRQYLFDLPVQEKFQNHVEVVKERFKLSKCQARYLKDRVFWRFRDEDHMLSKLTERKVTFRRKIQDGKSVILLLISQSMKKNYERYGDILCFDITYKLLMRKKDQVKHTGIGFFIGMDENSRILLYGVAVIQHESSDHFYMLFEFFFEMMCSVPQTILTDDQRAIGNALYRIKKDKKYDYVHLLDWYHKLEAVKRGIKRQPCKQELFSLFSRILKQPSRQVFEDIVREIASMLDKPEIMRDFLRDQKQCCLSQVPQKFFAFGISSTRAQAFNGLIKRSVPIQTNLGRLIFFVLRVQKRLMNRMAVLNYMNQQLISTITDKQMLILHSKLQCLAYQQMRQYYYQSRELRKIEHCQNPLKKRIIYVQYERQYSYNLMYDLKYGCWRCQCRNNFRTGMPCPHIFKVVREYGGCVSYYINQRWFHDKDNAQVKKPTRPSIRDKRI